MASHLTLPTALQMWTLPEQANSIKEVRTMALDLTKLTAAAERFQKANEAMQAAHQAALDKQADALDAESAKAEAAVAPTA